MTFQYSLNILKQYMYITTSTEKRIRYSVPMRTIQYGLMNSAMGQIPCSTIRISCYNTFSVFPIHYYIFLCFYLFIKLPYFRGETNAFNNIINGLFPFEPRLTGWLLTFLASGLKKLFGLIIRTVLNSTDTLFDTLLPWYAHVIITTIILLTAFSS